MKKVSSILLSLVYLVLSTGIAISAHYCCGTLQDVKINEHFADCCHHSEGFSQTCCAFEDWDLKINSDQQISAQNRINHHDILQLELGWITDHQAHLTNSVNKSCFIQNTSPPDNEHLWIVHCSLIFYG